MKKRRYSGFFAMIMLTLAAFVCIPENPIDTIPMVLDYQVTVDEAVSEISVSPAFELSEISIPSKQPEFSETHLFSASHPIQATGRKDETLSMDYWSETEQFVPKMTNNRSLYFT